MTAVIAKYWPPVLLSMACVLPLPAHGEHNGTTVSSPDFGSPDAVENLIADDDRLTPAMISKRLYQPWFDWKASVRSAPASRFGIDYTALYQASNNDAGNANASGGLVRFFGSWDLIGRGTKQHAVRWSGRSSTAIATVTTHPTRQRSAPTAMSASSARPSATSRSA